VYNDDPLQHLLIQCAHFFLFHTCTITQISIIV
jgi:hypothetical protein